MLAGRSQARLSGRGGRPQPPRIARLLVGPLSLTPALHFPALRFGNLRPWSGVGQTREGAEASPISNIMSVHFSPNLCHFSRSGQFPRKNHSRSGHLCHFVGDGSLWRKSRPCSAVGNRGDKVPKTPFGGWIYADTAHAAGLTCPNFSAPTEDALRNSTGATATAFMHMAETADAAPTETPAP